MRELFDLSLEIDFEITFKNHSGVTFSAPIRFDEVVAELEQSYLPVALDDGFETASWQRMFPLGVFEIKTEF